MQDNGIKIPLGQRKSGKTFSFAAMVRRNQSNRKEASREHEHNPDASGKHVETLLQQVFPGAGAVFSRAAAALFGALVARGSPLVLSIAKSLPGGRTSKKGLQEKVSGWLGRYDFATPVQRWLWNASLATVGRDTVIALDGGDLSKEFGGGGMEGMEMGYDASRGVTAMGHNLLCAAVANAPRARALWLRLLKGRKGLPEAERTLLSDIAACDRGFDSVDFVAHAAGLSMRTVVRVKEEGRDVFGTGRSIPAGMKTAPCAETVLKSPTRRQKALVRWREGHFPDHAGRYLPVLVVSSTFDGRTLYLHGIGFGPFASPLEAKRAALLAANAYFCRRGALPGPQTSLRP
jgi:hypothetical protein